MRGQALKEAVANGDVTYQRVLDAACTARSRAYSPLCQAALTINEEGGLRAVPFEAFQLS